MWFDLIMPIFYCFAGWLGGYIMVRRGSPAESLMIDAESARETGPRVGADSPMTASRREATAQQAREVEIAEATYRLRAFARSLAADVDAHQTEVQAVNNSLSESSDGNSEGAICIAVNRLIEANEAMQRQLQTAQDRIQSQASQLESAERQANTDPLTRVGNRRALDEHLARRVELGPEQAGTLALLDIDNFKRFNDLHGHRTGDEVLRVVAGLIHSRLDSCGIVARYGGEEFAIVLDGHSLEESLQLIESARQAIGSREIQFENKRLRVTASMGLARLDAGETVDGWIQRADDCLYRSKNEGRDCGHWSDAGKYYRIGDACSITEKARGVTSGDRKDTEGVRNVDERSTTRATPASTVTEVALASESHPFPYLPDRAELMVSVAELATHLRSSNMPMTVIAIQLGELVAGPASRSLLQIVRAVSRSIDQIGCDGPTTLLLCIAGADAKAALRRANQILRSAESLKLRINDEDSVNLVGLGIACWNGSDDFEPVFHTAEQLARDAVSETTEPIRVFDAQSSLAIV